MGGALRSGTACPLAGLYLSEGPYWPTFLGAFGAGAWAGWGLSLTSVFPLGRGHPQSWFPFAPVAGSLTVLRLPLEPGLMEILVISYLLILSVQGSLSCKGFVSFPLASGLYHCNWAAFHLSPGVGDTVPAGVVGC